MDAPPKLFDLAFEFVVNWYTTGRFPTKVIPPNTTLSDQIFAAVWRVRDCYDDHSKTLIKEFNPTKLELNLEYCRYGSFLEIRKLELTELIIRNFRRISRNLEWKHDFLFAKPFPELTHLHIGWAQADDDFLKRILPKLPKLQVVQANETEIHENAAPPSVTVYASTDLNAIMKSLAYFRITKDRHGTLWTIDKFWKIYENCWSVQRTCTPDQLTACVNEVEALINTFKFDERVMKSVNFCVGVFACFAMGDGHFNVNKLKIVRLLLQNLKNHLKIRTSPDHQIFEDIWFDIDKLMGNTENLNTDKIAALAMESIIHCGGNVQCCAKLLEKILDKIDLSSEFYKKINLRKLHERLNEIHKNTKMLAENRASAGEVLKYIERFM
ncbi:unnamed protein product [Caenorhabditis brenneri]